MNVTFHTITGLAIGSAMTAQMKDVEANKLIKARDIPLIGAGFVLGVISHGIMDILPHQYPFKSSTDIITALAIFLGAMLFVRKRFYLVFAFAFLGSIFPDLVDLGPEMANQFLGFSLPTSREQFFLWHRDAFSGSIYTKGDNPLSDLTHMLVMGFAGVVLLMNVGRVFWFMWSQSARRQKR